jgi:hypothetical protein
MAQRPLPLALPKGAPLPQALRRALVTPLPGSFGVGQVARRLLAVSHSSVENALSEAIAPDSPSTLEAPLLTVMPEVEVPAPGAAPSSSSTATGGGHGGNGFAACLAMLLLLTTFFLRSSQRTAHSQRPLSLSYAPPVPPG